ncbi:MAG: D-beta-D-heptose 7-phosphate kinase / D-beta-D-heptose 1-phosphate adenosyltransferase [Pseudonocardiales bacterium]|nr:D-beta-D-heptose 7-phosphate kinase / D-beta-D-heptose 1-phosphate adenosyltransferase [Pseudonocardiales bacterium]
MTAPLVVVGDVLLDVDLVGRSERMSPEAPVPVVSDIAERRRPGGAGLASWLAAQASDRRVVLVAPLADDDAAHEVSDLLTRASGLEILAVPWRGSTPVKTRIRVGDHPVARLDSGGATGIVGPLPTRVLEVLAGAAAILVCDYGRGAVAAGPLREAVATAAATVPVIWDPHPKGSAPVFGCALVTPNEAELIGMATAAGHSRMSPASGSDRAGRTNAELTRKMARHWQARAVSVTQGERGAMLCLGDNVPLVVSGQRLTAHDTCGAGDSYAAAAALAIADGCLPSEAVIRAVQAANRFVSTGGASTVDCDCATPASARADSGQPLRSRTENRPGEHSTVVATGGCFDLLHAGHIATLQAARALGDTLVVLLNSDASVRRLKGPDRPLQSEHDRARVLLALECVDDVVIFEEDTPATALRRLQPDVWAKGGDYTGADLPEAAVVAEWSGEAVIVPYLAGRSTSALVELAAKDPSR